MRPGSSCCCSIMLTTPSAARVIRIDPIANRTYHYWHVFVPGLSPGQIYGYRVEGPWDPARGMRFDPTKILLDPYGRGVVVPSHTDAPAAARQVDNCAAAMKSVVVDINTYDWEGDTPLRHPSARTIIYEMHVRALRGIPALGSAKRSAAHIAGLSRRSLISRSLGSPPSNCFPCSSSMHRIVRQGRSTTGVTSRSRSSRHTRRTALVRIRRPGG